MSSPQNIWAFNYNFEFELANFPSLDLEKGRFMPWYFLNRYSPLLMPLCNENDLIVSNEKPNPAIIEPLENKLGYKVEFIQKKELPENNSPLSNISAIISDNEKAKYSLQPWGWSSLAIEWEKHTKNHPSIPLLKNIKIINSKESSYGWRTNLLENSFHIPSLLLKIKELSLQQLLNQISVFYEEHSTFYIKHFFGTSGRLSDQITSPQIKNRKLHQYLKWIGSTGGLLLEKKLDFIREVSLHVDIEPNGTIKNIGITELLSRSDGSYRGNIIHPNESKVTQNLIKMLRPIFQKIASYQYVGPLGIDLLQTSESEYKLLEINGRWSMGRIALEWNGAINSYPVGLFIQESISRSKHASLIDFIKDCKKLENKFSLEITVINFVEPPGNVDKIWLTLFIGSSSIKKAMQIIDRIKNPGGKNKDL